jgi:hypothetical protein
MDIKDFVVGKTIYAIPTGNNVRIEKGIVTFKVISVKRKYVELQHQFYSVTALYDPKTGATQSEMQAGYGSDAGYIFFKTENSYKEYIKMCSFISRYIGYNFSKMKPETIKLIAKDLGYESDEQ